MGAAWERYGVCESAYRRHNSCPVVVSEKDRFLNIPVLIAFDILSQQYGYDPATTNCVCFTAMYTHMFSTWE